MVQVASIGGKNTHLTPGQKDAMNHMDYGFDISFEVLAICFIGLVLLILSCAGFFVYHCCPAWLPERIRDIRSRIYQTNGLQRKFPLRKQSQDEVQFFRSSFYNHDSSGTGGSNPTTQYNNAEPIVVVPNNLILTTSNLTQISTSSSKMEKT